jgi:hypothetical protein
LVIPAACVISRIFVGMKAFDRKKMPYFKDSFWILDGKNFVIRTIIITHPLPGAIIRHPLEEGNPNAKSYR